MAKIIITIEDNAEAGVDASWKFTPKVIRPDVPPTAAIQVAQHCIRLIRQIAATEEPAPAEITEATGEQDDPS